MPSRTDTIKSIIAAITGGAIATRPDIDEVITRVLVAVLAMLVTFLLAELLERANYNEIKDKARRKAARKGLHSGYEWDPRSTRDYRRNKN